MSRLSHWERNPVGEPSGGRIRVTGSGGRTPHTEAQARDLVIVRADPDGLGECLFPVLRVRGVVRRLRRGRLPGAEDRQGERRESVARGRVPSRLRCGDFRRGVRPVGREESPAEGFRQVWNRPSDYDPSFADPGPQINGLARPRNSSSERLTEWTLTTFSTGSLATGQRHRLLGEREAREPVPRTGHRRGRDGLLRRRGICQGGAGLADAQTRRPQPALLVLG